MNDLADKLEALDKAATQAEWSSYRAGNVTQIEARKAANGKNPCVIHWTGFDGNGYSQGKNRANATLITTLVNAYRAKQLVVADGDDTIKLLDARITALQARVGELSDTVAAMILEHDAGGITLSCMRDARATLAGCTDAG